MHFVFSSNFLCESMYCEVSFLKSFRKCTVCALSDKEHSAVASSSKSDKALLLVITSLKSDNQLTELKARLSQKLQF